MAYKAPKGITVHPAVATCESGDALGFDYKHHVTLKTGWSFSLGRHETASSGNFNTVHEFWRALPVQLVAVEQSAPAKKSSKKSSKKDEKVEIIFSKELQKSFYQTSSTIAEDVEEHVYRSAELMADACWDYLYMYGDYDGRETEVRTLLDTFGYKAVTKEAAKHVNCY